MDALALLCTLHADGPATWRRLRESGCHSLNELARFEPAELAELLGGTPASARRFLREAQHLSARAGVSWLEREDPAAARASEALRAPGSIPVPDASTRPSALPPRDQVILERVLTRWREQDSSAEVPQEEPSAERRVEVPAAPELHALAAGSLDGLDEARCEQLRAAGVATFEDLVAADLARVGLHSGLGYSRLARWKSLAERALRDGAAPMAAPVSAPAREIEERLSPAEFPAHTDERELLQLPLRDVAIPRHAVRWTPVEESVAGPFAQD